jgi:hypothetical protein
MHKLTLYKNNDPAQPQTFEGRTLESTMYKLKQWMDANQGKRSTDAFGVDGLTIFPHPFFEDDEMVFRWDETYEEWRLEFGPHPDDADTWAKDHFDSARDEFLEAVKMFGDWDW